MTTVPVHLPEDLADDDEPIHGEFSLSYANYLVVPRTLLQSMPVDWQRPFVALMRQLNEAFEHIERAESYHVEAGEEREIGELTATEMQSLGVTPPDPFDENDADDEESDTTWEQWRQDARWLYRGEEYESWERIVYPKRDPVPHYNRGRTYVEPRLPQEVAQ